MKSAARSIVLFVASGLLPLATGCGTFASQLRASSPHHGATAPVVYGGIRTDGRWIGEAFERGGAQPFLTPLIILDLPISSVADTVILPWTIYQRAERQQRKRELEEHLEAHRKELEEKYAQPD